MTMEEEIDIVKTYFKTHGLGISRAFIVDDGTITIDIPASSFQHFPEHLRKIFKTGHFKWLVRLGYSSDRWSRVTSNSRRPITLQYLSRDIQEGAKYCLPRHYYCKNDGQTPITPSLNHIPNPTSSSCFRQTPYNNFPKMNLRDVNLAYDGYHIVAKTYGQGTTYWYQFLDYGFVLGGNQSTTTFNEWRDYKTQHFFIYTDLSYNMRSGIEKMPHKVEHIWSAAICFELVYSSKEVSHPIHLLYQIGPLAQWSTPCVWDINEYGDWDQIHPLEWTRIN